jgi:hypothetical protein
VTRRWPFEAVAIYGACFSMLGCGRVDTVVGTQVAPEVDAGGDAELPRAVYLEAESGRLSGFTVQTDPTVSGGEYILPPADSQLLSVPGDASASYTFTVAAGTYFIWGRIHSPSVDNNTLWMTLDDGQTQLWRLSTGVIWYWRRITDGTDYGHPISFELDGGSHDLVVRNADAKVGLDRIYVTSLGDEPVPSNDTPCDPPNSIQLADGGCELSCGSHMNATCVAGVQDCGGNPVLVSYDCAVCCHVPAVADGGASD